RRHEARGALAAAVVVAVARVQRQREEAPGLPLEGALPLRRLHRRAAVPVEDVHDLFEEMLLRRGLLSRWDLADVHADAVAAAVGVLKRAERVHAGAL